MWLMTKQGFYSVVQHRDDPDVVLVRARAQKDIEALREQIPDLDIYSDPHADYLWRAEVSREDWQAALVEFAEAIDYDNYKNAVQSKEHKTLYMQVWSTMLRLQRSTRDQLGAF